MVVAEAEKPELDFSALVSESKSLNSSVFSLVRMQLLSTLATANKDGATYRELKAWLDLSDGALYSNVKALEEMGYVKSEKIIFEGKELESYRLTSDGLAEWARVRAWLARFVNAGGRK